MSFSEPPRDDEGGALTGVAVAIVAENDDPKGLGRVKLRYPWLETAGASNWARIAVPMAGADRGTYFLPEVGDEVLVAFDDGDIDHPYVLGALWNGEDEPPEDNADGENDVRQITSRSGHELTFDDADGDEAVRIETSGGHSVVLDDGDETITIEDTGGNQIEFDGSSRSLSISSEATVTIEAPSIEIKSSGNLDLEASGVLSLDGALITLN
jgi:phage baseplate assembly protein V